LLLEAAVFLLLQVEPVEKALVPTERELVILEKREGWLHSHLM
jgi:hypothetical protein